MVKLKVLKSFYDKEKQVTRQIDEVIEVSEKRASEILSHPLELVEKVEELNFEEVPKEPKRKKVK